MRISRIGALVLAAGTVAALANATQASTITVVDDSFTSGDRDDEPGDPLDAGWWGTTGSSAIEIDGTGLGLRSGSSGRGFRGIFPEQSLVNVGDKLTATYTFVTPATVGVEQGTDFRIGLYNSQVNAAFGTSADLAQDLTASSSNQNDLYLEIGGYMADYDVGFTAEPDDANISIRERLTTPAFFQQGRLMATTGVYQSLGSGDDIDGGYSFDQANTEYVGVLSVTRTSSDTVEIFSSLSEGVTLLNSFSAVDDLSDASSHSGITTSFSQLGFHVGSNAFGSTNASGEADNGITFTNVTIEFSAIPEPSSLALAFGAVAGLLGRRRRG